MVFFKPCEHDTALQPPDDTSAKFRGVLKSVFQLLPEGFTEVALNDLTETATFSQHASAGFALSTVLHYIDKNTPDHFEKFAPQLKLGDDCANVSGSVAGGYLHCSKVDTKVSKEQPGFKYTFTEESGHYGRRWTIPGVRTALTEFMEDSGLEAHFTLKPYHREKPPGTIKGLFGESALQSLSSTDNVDPSPPETAEGLLEDVEWDFD